MSLLTDPQLHCGGSVCENYSPLSCPTENTHLVAAHGVGKGCSPGDTLAPWHSEWDTLMSCRRTGSRPMTVMPQISMFNLESRAQREAKGLCLITHNQKLEQPRIKARSVQY